MGQTRAKEQDKEGNQTTDVPEPKAFAIDTVLTHYLGWCTVIHIPPQPVPWQVRLLHVVCPSGLTFDPARLRDSAHDFCLCFWNTNDA